MHTLSLLSHVPHLIDPLCRAYKSPSINRSSTFSTSALCPIQPPVLSVLPCPSNRQDCTLVYISRKMSSSIVSLLLLISSLNLIALSTYADKTNHHRHRNTDKMPAALSTESTSAESMSETANGIKHSHSESSGNHHSNQHQQQQQSDGNNHNLLNWPIYGSVIDPTGQFWRNETVYTARMLLNVYNEYNGRSGRISVAGSF